MQGLDIAADTPRLASDRAWGWLALALAAAFLTVFFRIGSLPLLQPDEGRNAEVAREMKESGAWLVPTYNGLTYLDKPAFYFKAVATSLAVFGDNELGARLPSALFGLGVLALVWTFCRRECGPRAAALSALVVATTPLFISQARTVIFDIALAVFVCLAIMAGYLAEETQGSHRRHWYLVFGAAIGFATLVKGPVGFLVPTLVLVAFNLADRRAGAVRRLFGPFNWLTFLVVVLPWFVGVSLAHPDFPYYGLIHESWQRFTTTQFHRTAPFYYYLLVLPATFFPWSLLLPEAGYAGLKRWKTLPRVSRLAIVWCIVVVIFFSLSRSKLPGYILSATVPFGVLVAQVLDAAIRSPDGRAARVLRRATMAFAFVTLFLGTGIAVFLRRLDQMDPTLQFRGVDVAQTSQAAMPVIALLFVATTIAGWSVLRREPRLAAVGFALLPVMLVVLGSGIAATIYEARSARSMAAALSDLPPTAELVFYRSLPSGLPFYLRRTGTLVTSDGGELTSNYQLFSLERAPNWPEQVVRVDDFDAWLSKRPRAVYVVAQDVQRMRLADLASRRGVSLREISPGYVGVLLPPPGGS